MQIHYLLYQSPTPADIAEMGTIIWELWLAVPANVKWVMQLYKTQYKLDVRHSYHYRS